MDEIKGKSIAVRIWHSDQSMQRIEKELKNASVYQNSGRKPQQQGMDMRG